MLRSARAVDAVSQIYAGASGREAEAMQLCSAITGGIPLGELLPRAAEAGAADVRVYGCVCDSRSVAPGDLFVAIRGSRVDGADFVAEAAARGAVAIACEEPLIDSPLPVIPVADARETFARLCQHFAGNPGQRLKLIGVTGTNGKTTTAHLIATILSAAEFECGLIGTLGYFDGADLEPAAWTTPPADVSAELLRRMVAHGCTHAVMEVSSHGLDQARVAGLDFEAACITNIRRDHLDYHRTWDRYRAAKAKLIAQVKPGGPVVINADDAGAASLLPLIDGPVLTIGLEADADISAEIIEQCLSEQTFLLTAGSETVPVRTSLIGRHHVSNCLAAAAVGLALGIDLLTVVRGLESVKRVPGRLERLECGQPFGVFIDYAHTPDALETVLATLRGLTGGKLICVFGAGGQRDAGKRPLMGKAVERFADLAVVTSDNPRRENPAQIIREIVAGFHSTEKVEIVPDRATAIRWALSAAEPGDCVLIAGKGHERYQIVGDQRIAFDDAEVACEWLYEVCPYADAA